MPKSDRQLRSSPKKRPFYQKSKTRKICPRKCKKTTSNDSNRGMAWRQGATKAYFVEEIVDERVDEDGNLEYFVKWWGWKSEDNTWEPASILMKDCPIKLLEFKQERGLIEDFDNNQHPKSARAASQVEESGSESESEDLSQMNYKIEKVLDKRETNGVIKYFVTWIGLDSNFNSWESLQQVNKECPQLVKEYEESRHATHSPVERSSSSASTSSNASPLKDNDVGVGGDFFEDQKVSRARPSRSGVEEKSRVDIIAKSLEAESILGVHLNDDGMMFFLVKWKDRHEASLVPTSVAKVMWPQEVIRFYEFRATWVDETSQRVDTDDE